MERLWQRLRAAMATPGARALLIVLGLMLLAASLFTRRTEESLEERVSRTLSAMEGAGRVEVVIRMKEGGQEDQTGLLRADTAQQAVPCGAIAVAEGADDPLVRMRLTQALCALLGLQASAVSIISASGGGL